MQITAEQLDAISMAFLVSRLRNALASEFPESRDIPPEQMRTDLIDVIKTAERHGFSKVGEVEAYTILAWRLGKDFLVQFPAFKDIANDANLSNEDKLANMQALSDAIFDALNSGGK